jgi:hypothetical protein
MKVSSILFAALLLVSLGGAGGHAAVTDQCRGAGLGPAYAARVESALLAQRDILGERLIAAPSGPTYAAAKQYLPPLLLVGRPAGAGGLRLTGSGVYYLAFGQPVGAGGGGAVALHVADGSQIVSDRTTGPSLTLAVGRRGDERYGSCLARLATPRLYGGYLPILDTAYTDADGVRYRQESFASRIGEASALVSFVRLSIDLPRGAPPVKIRLTASRSGLVVAGPGARVAGSSVEYVVSRATTVYAAWLDQPAVDGAARVDVATYDAARGSLIRYWTHRLAEGTVFVVPERRVLDAERNVLLQNLLLTWRYSVGNAYESFEYPESLETAGVMGEYGFAAVDRAIVGESLRREPHLYSTWEAAMRLLEAGRYFALSGDEEFLAAATPSLERDTDLLAGQLPASGAGLLAKERYTADLPDVAYGFATQAVAWQALGSISRAWAATGRSDLAGRASSAAAVLEAGLRSALSRSAQRLPDGSLFVPARLLDGEKPYASLTATVRGSYWNLVVPDALASGLLPPGGVQADGVLRYLYNHGSRLLGLPRFNYYAESVGGVRAGGLPGYRTSGTDDVYALDLVRFLADNDQPDQLALSLYGQLADGMTDGTFVSGEGATVSPVPGQSYRSMYLPPNSTGNAAFLETLRALLVHETRTADGTPSGLELAFATPRGWLEPGKRIAVNRAPTSFGPVSYTLDATRTSVRVRLEVPARAAIQSLRLRLRLPRGERIVQVVLAGRPHLRFDPASQTIDLTGLTGTVTLTARVAGAS